MCFLLLFSSFAHEASAMTVSPVKLEFAADPGKTVDFVMKLYNEEAESKTLYSSFQNFEAAGESGAPIFPAERKDLALWAQAQPQITIEPGQRIEVPITIPIPLDAKPGGYFAAAFWGEQPPSAQDGGLVNIGGKLGTLMLLRVNGEIAEKGGLLEFGMSGDRRFFDMLPVEFWYRVANDGAGRIKPAGTIRVTDTWGNPVAELDANKSDGNILPGSVRRFTEYWVNEGQGIELDTRQLTDEEKLPKGRGYFEAARGQWEHFLMGKYTAVLDITYGEEKVSESATYRFYIIPWQVLSFVGSIFAGILLIIFVGLKQYKRWIIRTLQANIEAPTKKRRRPSKKKPRSKKKRRASKVATPRPRKKTVRRRAIVQAQEERPLVAVAVSSSAQPSVEEQPPTEPVPPSNP